MKEDDCCALEAIPVGGGRRCALTGQCGMACFGKIVGPVIDAIATWGGLQLDHLMGSLYARGTESCSK